MTDVDLLFSIIAEEFGISRERITSDDRRTVCLFGRETIAAILRKEDCYKLKAIGRVLNRDYSTVINSLKKFEYDYKYNIHYRDKFDKIKNKYISSRNNGCLPRG